jgi:hypothetical protein
LLGNYHEISNYTTIITRQQPVNSNRGMISVSSVPRCCKQDKLARSQFLRAEAGSNTSTIALRVIGGDKKGVQCPGVKLGHTIPEGYEYGDLALQVGVSNLRQQNMVISPVELGPENDWADRDHQ